MYVRELMQNAVDAVTVRAAADDRPALLLVPSDVAADGRLHAMDSGVGLDEDDVRTFLATIGRSSKRDELGLARSNLLGQFGIGLLSCFMVSEDIEVVSRRADGPWVRWVGHADGTYELSTLPDGLPSERRAGGVAGARSGNLRDAGPPPRDRAPARRRLRRGPGPALRLLPAPPGRGADRTSDEVDTSLQTPPWRIEDVGRRRAACVELAAAELGGVPFHVLPIRVPQAGLDGVAVIGGSRAASASPGRHRVHLKGMLLSDQVSDLVPEWAFFVRCAVDSQLLRPTANREALFDDDLLEHTRTEIGAQVRAWLVRLASTQPERMARFLAIHQVAVKAMALQDDEMLRIVLPLLPFETNQGRCTLPDLMRTTDVVRVAATVDDFRQVGSVLAAQGVAVVNGGYTFDLDLVRRLVDVEPAAVVEVVAPADVDGHVRLVTDERLREVAAALGDVRAALDGVQVDVDLRTFAPASLPALLLDEWERRDRREVRAAAAEADDVWSALLGAFDDGGSDRPRLLLNDANPTVRRVLVLQDAALRHVAAESLYGRALLAGGRRLRPVDTALIDRSFNDLLDRAVVDAPEGTTTVTVTRAEVQQLLDQVALTPRFERTAAAEERRSRGRRVGGRRDAVPRPARARRVVLLRHREAPDVRTVRVPRAVLRRPSRTGSRTTTATGCCGCTSGWWSTSSTTRRSRWTSWRPCSTGCGRRYVAAGEGLGPGAELRLRAARARARRRRVGGGVPRVAPGAADAAVRLRGLRAGPAHLPPGRAGPAPGGGRRARSRGARRGRVLRAAATGRQHGAGVDRRARRRRDGRRVAPQRVPREPAQPRGDGRGRAAPGGAGPHGQRVPRHGRAHGAARRAGPTVDAADRDAARGSRDPAAAHGGRGGGRRPSGARGRPGAGARGRPARPRRVAGARHGAPVRRAQRHHGRRRPRPRVDRRLPTSRSCP